MKLFEEARGAWIPEILRLSGKLLDLIAVQSIHEYEVCGGGPDRRNGAYLNDHGKDNRQQCQVQPAGDGVHPLGIRQRGEGRPDPLRRGRKGADEAYIRVRNAFYRYNACTTLRRVRCMR